MSARAHLLIVAVTIANLLFVLRLVRRGQLRAKYSILWLSVGGALIMLAASPPLLDGFARAVGIDYGPAAFFLAALCFLFLTAVHFSWELSRLEERTRKLAEEFALFRLAEEWRRRSDQRPDQPPVEREAPVQHPHQR